jgi:hypothetical protein
MNKANETNTAQNTQANGGKTVEVLYQKMGDRWFAFSVIGDELFVGSITQEEIDALEKQEAAGGARQRRVYGKKTTGNA